MALAPHANTTSIISGSSVRYSPNNQGTRSTTINVKYLVGHFGGFPVRLPWLPRLVDKYLKDGRVPANLEIVACDLGVGKNMAKAIRAWARAAGILSKDGRLTPLAECLFVRHDPFLERGETVALLHWLIASNMESFTVNAWIFNFVRNDTFFLRDAVEGFREHAASNSLTYAEGSLRGDIEPSLRMHLALDDMSKNEGDDRIFAKLGLLKSKREGGGTIFTRTWAHDRAHISQKLLLHSLLDTLARRKTASSALSDLYAAVMGRASPGSVFGYTRDGFFDALEQLDRDRHSEISLSSMPGEDALLTVTGPTAASCARGDSSPAYALFFGDGAWTECVSGCQ